MLSSKRLPSSSTCSSLKKLRFGARFGPALRLATFGFRSVSLPPDSYRRTRAMRSIWRPSRSSSLKSRPSFASFATSTAHRSSSALSIRAIVSALSHCIRAFQLRTL